MTHASFYARLKSQWRRHGLLLTTLVVLSVLAGGTRYLTASLVVGEPNGPRTTPVGAADTAQACASRGTMFDTARDPQMRTPDAVMRRYRFLASQAFAEREQALRNPAQWRCKAQTFDEMAPPSPTLSTLANELPGWAQRQQDNCLGMYGPGPFNPNETPKCPSGSTQFSDFSGIMMEFQRIYECKLTELQQSTIDIVFGDDPAGSSSSVGDSVFDSPRTRSIIIDIDEEKSRSRIAMERSLLAMRSFELAAPFTVEMECLQRETVDVRLMMSLLSDAVSCLPRIWDITTSLHDRDGE